MNWGQTFENVESQLEPSVSECLLQLEKIWAEPPKPEIKESKDFEWKFSEGSTEESENQDKNFEEEKKPKYSSSKTYYKEMYESKGENMK